MTLIEMLQEVDDPRSFHGREYRLHHILLFTILAILANAKTYTDVASFISVHYDRLREIFKLKWRHVPDVSAIRKIIVAVDPAEIERVFRQDAEHLESQSDCQDKHICADGKTLRGSFSHTKDKRAERVFNVFSSQSTLVLAHIPMGSDKDDEIGAFQQFLLELNLKGVVVTADALHCQKKHLSTPPLLGPRL
jgi:hypothetical protein